MYVYYTLKKCISKTEHCMSLSQNILSLSGSEQQLRTETSDILFPEFTKCQKTVTIDEPSRRGTMNSTMQLIYVAINCYVQYKMTHCEL